MISQGSCQLQFSKRYENDRGGVLVFLLIIISIFAAIYFAPSPLIGWMGRLLVVDETPTEQADAIVILIGGAGPERVIRAAELYRQGLARRIVFGSGYLPAETRATARQINWQTTGEQYKQALKALGVPDSAIMIIDTVAASDTSMELGLIAKVFSERKWFSALLVTSASHSLRAKLIWHRSAPDVTSYMASAGRKEFKTWWQSSYQRSRVVYEYLGLVKEVPKQIMFKIKTAINFLQKLRKDPSELG